MLGEDTDSYCTARWLAFLLGRYDFDPCSNPRSHIDAPLTYMLEAGECGLRAVWPLGLHGFINPPYSDPLPWVIKAIRYARLGGRITMLLKADLTTRWYARLFQNRGLTFPFRRRLAFELGRRKKEVPPWGAMLVTLNTRPNPDVMRHVYDFSKVAA